MQIRPGHVADLDHLLDLDATIESMEYLHVNRDGEGLAAQWRLEVRPLREKLILKNALAEDAEFQVKQVLSGIEEGIVRVAEHSDHLTGLAAARLNPERKTLELLDVRVDYEFRREGIGSALLYQIISFARDGKLRAVTAITPTNNLPAAQFLSKAGFDLAGLDTHLHSNHDLVKEQVALFWYLALD